MSDKLPAASICCGCEACADICPLSAISMEPDFEGFLYPHIDDSKCTHCGACERVCPVINAPRQRHELLCAYACRCKDEEIRADSTSGGVFSILARHIIERYKGHVYGVIFDENFVSKFICVSEIYELEKLRGSKYPQARANDIYRTLRNDLEESNYILFTGLPCHIEAARSFLGREYDRLFLMDMACLGVASPGIWNKYRITCYPHAKKINFKSKHAGWKNWQILVDDGDEKHYYSRYDDQYMKGYLQKNNIRPSCFQCRFKGLNRNSDFTIADCWGDGEASKLNDDKGLSALLLHTEKARSLWNDIKDEFLYEKYSPEILMRGNWAMFNSAVAGLGRKEFFIKNNSL